MKTQTSILALGLLLCGATAACEDTGIFASNSCDLAHRRIVAHLEDCGVPELAQPAPAECSEALGESQLCQAKCLEDVSCETLVDPSSSSAGWELESYSACLDECVP